MTFKEFISKYECTDEEKLSLNEYLAFLRFRHIFRYFFGGN